jgi:hypothetical protein
MGLLTYIKNRIRSKLVPIGGTLATPTDDETFATHISNEGLGGPFTARTLEEMAQIPIERLTPGCFCTVLEHVRPNGSLFTRVRFVLDPRVTDWQALLHSNVLRIANISNYDISQYWRIDSEIGTFQDTLETQYAVAYDYGNPIGPERPYFYEPYITKERYQAGYANNTDATTIWHTEFDPLTDKYERKRFGSQSDWGIPVLITGESYVAGDYIDNMFKWVDKGIVIIAPPSMIDGASNSNPEGWQGTPAVPDGLNYYDYIQLHDLYQITATKTVFGILKTPWTIKKISTDPNLIRYGHNPGSTDYIGENGEDTADWRGYYTPNKDSHMAIRLTTDSAWRIEMIDNEEGEYVDFIFKLFPIGYEPLESDRPTISNPFGVQEPDNPNTGCYDSPPVNIPLDEVLHRSVGRKYNNGILKPSGWSFWTRADGLDVVQVHIEPSDTAFKHKGETVSPSVITMTANFTKGGEDIVPTENYKWYKGIVEPANEIIKGSAVGVSANHTISGTNNDTLTIDPDAVDSAQTYHIKAMYGGEDYYDVQTILDVTDAVGIIAVIEAPGGFIYKNGQGSKTFKGVLYENGIEVTTGLSYAWTLNNENITPANNQHQVTVIGDQVDGQEVLKVVITRNGVSYTWTETLVDLNDADQPMFEWSINGVDWSSNPSGAVYMRTSVDGGLTWSAAILIKGENAPFNGGFERNVYINMSTKPTASGLTASLFPNAISGKQWTSGPTALQSGELYTWFTKAFFQKNPANNDTALTTTNWTMVGSWSDAVRTNGIDGEGSSVPGPIGNPGWTPIFANPADGARVVQRVVDWTNPVAGATGKPATGMYVSSTGFTTNISSAQNIKGPKGDDGIFMASDFWDGDEMLVKHQEGSPIDTYVSIRLRKSRVGIVYYTITGRKTTSGGDKFLEHFLGTSTGSFAKYVPLDSFYYGQSISFYNDTLRWRTYTVHLAMPVSPIFKNGEIKRDWVGMAFIGQRVNTNDFYLLTHIAGTWNYTATGTYMVYDGYYGMQR